MGKSNKSESKKQSAAASTGNIRSTESSKKDPVGEDPTDASHDDLVEKSNESKDATKKKAKPSSSDSGDDSSNESPSSSPSKATATKSAKKQKKKKKSTSTSTKSATDVSERILSSSITAAGSFDPTSRVGQTNARDAAISPSTWKHPSVSTSNRTEYVGALAFFNDKWSPGLLSVPDKGDGMPASAPKTLGGREYVDINFDSYTSIIDPKVQPPTKARIVSYAHWFHGDTQKILGDTSTDTMVSMAIDPNLPGNEGLVNQKKIDLRRQDAVLYQYLLNLIPGECFTQFRIHEKEYKFEDEADPTTKYCSGLILLAMLMEALKPSSTIDVGHLENQLEKLTFEGVKFNLVTYITKHVDLLQKIQAERGVEYDDNRVMTRFFQQLKGHKNEEWLTSVYSVKNDWQLKKIKRAEIFATLTTVYNNMVTVGDWGKIDERNKQVIALSTQLNQVASQLKKTKSLLDNRIPRKSNKGGTGGEKADSSTQQKKKGAPSWQITKKGPTIQHPEKDIKMEWCPHHTSKCGEVNGMYMPAPHDHEAWRAAKDKRIAHNQALREKRKAETSGATRPSKKASTDNNSVSKLALSKSLLTGLATNFEISGPDAEKFIKESIEDAAQSKE